MAKAKNKRTTTRRKKARDGRSQPPVTPEPRGVRQPWIIVIGVLLVGCAVIAGLLIVRGHDAEPKNLLLITLDTTRADHLGIYGSTVADTPHMDRLARQGVWFSACTTSAPTTLPAHSSLMTSQEPFVLGVRRNGVNALAPSAETLAERLQAEGYETGATVAAFVLSRRFGIAQGFDVYHEVTAKHGANPMVAERPGDEVADDAAEMLDSFGDQPFFLWVHFFDAHYPYLPRGGAVGNSREAYAREVEFVDEQVGRLMAALDESGLSDTTLTVVVGDHGEDLQDHGEVTHGYFLYDTTLRVPLILHSPGHLPQGMRIDSRVGIVDIAPTILDLFGVDGLPGARGISLLGLVNGSDSDEEHAVYSETLEPWSQLGLSMLRSLSQGDWKYILAPTPELFNLARDPGETRNLAGEYPDRVQIMHEKLRERVVSAQGAENQNAAGTNLSRDEIQKLRSLGYLEGAQGVANEADADGWEHFDSHGADPKDHVAEHRLLIDSHVLIQEGRFSDAEILLRGIIESVPTTVQGRLSLIESLGAQGRDAEVVDVCEQALEIAPDNASVLPAYARALRSTGRVAEAIEQFERLLDNPVGRVMAHAELAITYMGIGEVDSAERHIRAALEIEPGEPRLLQMLASLPGAE